jgi:hypothetical protein
MAMVLSLKAETDDPIDRHFNMPVFFCIIAF